MTIKIVLVEPSVQGNIGAIARVMKNFGFKDLVLINPQVEISGDVFRFAMNAQDILEEMKIYDTLDELLKTVTYVVGTTARIGSDRGTTDARIAVSSADPSIQNIIEFEGDVAILFGREDSGLTNKEVNACDMTIHIPTEDEYKALNLAQAVSIILYSLHIRKQNVFEPNYRTATLEEKELLLEWFEKAVSVLNLDKKKEKNLIRRFHNIIGRSFVSGKEATSLVAIFSRTYNRITELSKKQ
ncbi:MAG: RNA methyltransferase [Candidatus Heimdallarchaeota archaeon]